MKLQVAISDSGSEVDIRYDRGRITALIDGRSCEVDVKRSDAGDYLLIYQGRVFDCRVEGRPGNGEPVDVAVGNHGFSVVLTDPKRLQSAASAGTHADGVVRIVASMPGKVVRVLTELGDQIEAGAGIAVVEAMKMQNEMKSPKAGTVVALNVQAGATVNGGDVLAIIE